MITYKELGALIEIAARSLLSSAERVWLDGLSERILAEQQKRMEQEGPHKENVNGFNGQAVKLPEGEKHATQ